MIKECVLLTPSYQNECLASELPSSACPTKKPSFQMLKYSHWPKRGFCRPPLHVLKAQTNWLNQVAWGKALIWVQRPQVCNKQTSWGASLWNFPLGEIITVRRAYLVWDLTNKRKNKQTNNVTCPSALKRLAAVRHPSSKTTFSPRISKARSVYI